MEFGEIKKRVNHVLQDKEWTAEDVDIPSNHASWLEQHFATDTEEFKTGFSDEKEAIIHHTEQALNQKQTKGDQAAVDNLQDLSRLLENEADQKRDTLNKEKRPAIMANNQLAGKWLADATGAERLRKVTSELNQALREEKKK